MVAICHQHAWMECSGRGGVAVTTGREEVLYSANNKSHLSASRYPMIAAMVAYKSPEVPWTYRQGNLYTGKHLITTRQIHVKTHQTTWFSVFHGEQVSVKISLSKDSEGNINDNNNNTNNVKMARKHTQLHTKYTKERSTVYTFWYRGIRRKLVFGNVLQTDNVGLTTRCRCWLPTRWLLWKTLC